MDKVNEKKERRKKIIKTLCWIGVASLSVAAIAWVIRDNRSKAKNKLNMIGSWDYQRPTAKEQIQGISGDNPHIAHEHNTPPHESKVVKTTRDDAKLIAKCNKLLKILAKDSNNRIMIDDEVDWPVEGVSFRPYIYKHTDKDDD